MPEFAFVVSDGKGNKRPSAAARSHAVRSGLQRKNQSETAGGSEDSRSTIRQRDSLKGRFRLSDGKGKVTKAKKKGGQQMAEAAVQAAVHAQSRLAKSPSQGQDDPFSTFPVPLTGDVHKLVRFYVSRFELPLPIAAIQKEWWEYAQTDTLLMHSTLGVAAAMWESALPGQSPAIVVREGYRQKGLAIRGVQERLNRGDNSMVLVGAIANLANMEGVEGNFEIARLHLQGLDQLVKTWPNKYNEMKANVNVARTVNWSDIQAANGLGLKPLLPIIMPLDSIVLPLSVLTASEQPSVLHLKSFEKNDDDATVRFSFSLVRQAVFAANHPDVPGSDFRVLINATDHFLAATAAGNQVSDLGRVFVSAAHVVYYAVVRQVPLGGLVPRRIVRRLRTQLEAYLDKLGRDPTCQLGLLWVLLVGAAATCETDEDFDYFSSNLLMMLLRLNVREPVELETIARRFMLPPKFPGGFLRRYGPAFFAPTLEI